MSKLLLIASILLIGCAKYNKPNHRNEFRCTGISSPDYYGEWQYFMIKHPGQTWQFDFLFVLVLRFKLWLF